MNSVSPVKPKSENEEFVRAHCMFVNSYFLGDVKSIYCSKSDKPFSNLIASGNGVTEDEAWTDCADKVRQRLAKLETLQNLIGEVDNSAIPSKETLRWMLAKKFEKLGRGMAL